MTDQTIGTKRALIFDVASLFVFGAVIRLPLRDQLRGAGYDLAQQFQARPLGLAQLRVMLVDDVIGERSDMLVLAARGK